MKKLIYLSFLTVLIITSCNPNVCIDFNNSSSFPVGTTYHYNDSIYYAAGFVVRTDSLFINGKGYYNFGRLENAVSIFGSAQVMNTNNITLKFTKITPINQATIKFDYLDRGGTSNLSINGSLFSGKLSAAPASLGGATVTVTSTPIPLPAKGTKGTVKISGVIKDFNIGGQEFYLDNICFQ